jgi:hypothetical protein
LTTRAYVGQDFAQFRGLAVYLVDQRGDTSAIGLPVELTFQTITDEQSSATQQPTLRLPEDMARALLDALAAHFGGTSDVQTLRKDYVAERARVDKMIAHLTGPS